MARNGQFRPKRPVAVFALDFRQGATPGRHSHPFGQLLWSVAGVLRARVQDGTWILPPGRALWIPANTKHEVEMVTAVEMRTVYVVPKALPAAPRASRVVRVEPLLRELILEAQRLPRPYPLGGAEERLFRVLLDQIEFDDVLPLHLPLPRSARLVEVTTALEADPADRRTLAQWARTQQASSRTLARDFRKETGFSFGAWRAQLRLLRALELLAAKRSVTQVALALGYESTSAFITRFQRHLGVTPARYFRAAAAARRQIKP